jgi:hypothetical protein
MIVGVRGRGRPVAAELFAKKTQYYGAIILYSFRAHESRSRSRRRTTKTAVTFSSLGLTGGRGDLNRYTAETCTATAVPLRRWGLRVGGGQIESLL